MHDAVAFPLKEWETFYVIVGSTSGALIGLQFVVLTLIAGTGVGRTHKDSIAAFGSPNVVHFCSALLASAILSAPWAMLRHAGLAVFLCGLFGIAYGVVVLRRALKQSAYEPVGEDWVWHVVLPLVAYLTLLVAGLFLGAGSIGAMFFVSGAVLLLVFIGIHNAWDTITYVTTEGLDRPRAEAVGNPATPAGPTTDPGEPPTASQDNASEAKETGPAPS